MSEIETGELDELPLGADALEEHDEVEAEEHNWIDGRSAAIRIALGHPRADEAEVEDRVEVAVEIVWWDEPFEGDDNRSVEIADVDGPSMAAPQPKRRRDESPILTRNHPCFFTGPGRF